MVGFAGSQTWRMTGSAWTRWTLQVQCRRLLYGGSLREGVGSRFWLMEDLAHDGERIEAFDVAGLPPEAVIGRESEGGSG